ncbi:MAG TPA: MerR family transcriptional regulator [Polyangia bacterium]|jgi:DNA-binding transcriptional MerR regulator
MNGTWDTGAAITIVRTESGVSLTVRQLQYWDRQGVIVPEHRGPRRTRIYGFDGVRRLCLVARLLKAGFPSNRLGAAVRNIDGASAKIGKNWDELRIVTDGAAVFVVDGERAMEAETGQLVALILLSDLDEGARRACRRVPVWRRAA